MKNTIIVARATKDVKVGEKGGVIELAHNRYYTKDGKTESKKPAYLKAFITNKKLAQKLSEEIEKGTKVTIENFNYTSFDVQAVNDDGATFTQCVLALEVGNFSTVTTDKNAPEPSDDEMDKGDE